MSSDHATPRVEAIRLRGVRHHNLKNFDLDLPLHRLTVITGLSGSGKSTLAFDTLFAEGQRRYVETFSPYARQFFDRMDKPQVDRVEGIPPAIAIEQRNTVKTTRSTVGTMTELADYLKVLWPHVAELRCQGCGRPVRKDSPATIWTECRREFGDRADVLITFTLPLAEQVPWSESLTLISRQGYQRLLLGGEVVRIDAAANRAPDGTSVTVVQDRIALTPANRGRFVEACEQALHFGRGHVRVRSNPAGTDAAVKPLNRAFSQAWHCAECNREYREPSPALFSFNHPLGACPACRGFGRVIGIDYGLAIPDRTRTLAGGAVRPWQTGVSAECQIDLLRWCRGRKIPVNIPFCDLPEEVQQLVIQGEPDYGIDDAHKWPRVWYGVKGYFRWLESQSYKMHYRVLLSRYRSYTTCNTCRGQRLQPDALAYRLPAASAGPGVAADLNLADIFALSVDRAGAVFSHLARHDADRFPPRSPVALALEEVRARLQYLTDVGLGYLTLDRPTRTLSGGETERVSLTTCLGTRLVNTLYVLDEPSVGLHPRDTDRLVRILHALRDAGNTVVVVEHEASVIRAADHIVDIGPGHGATGGEVVYEGSVPGLLRDRASLTGAYLAGRQQLPEPPARSVGDSVPGLRWLTVKGARSHNLCNLTVRIPLARFVCLTGVSGSGKTTLAREVLHPLLVAALPKVDGTPGATAPAEAVADDDGNGPIVNEGATLSGHELLHHVVLVDQSPLGRTPRSNAALYIGAFDDIREIFAGSEFAQMRNLTASEFSFNWGTGRCERCQGAGFEKIEMQFLSDVFITCPDCQGRRYRPHVLEVKLAGRVERLINGRISPGGEPVEWSIADLLEATVDEVVSFLGGMEDNRHATHAAAKLRLLQEFGLGYLQLGQAVNTLSGGESQRLKLVAHLAKSSPRDLGAGTLFIFDEPTTGLHFDDVRILLAAFQRLVDAGNSLLVIEHNLEVIRAADWLIDLGPEAGEAGGEIVVAGPPAVVAECPRSHTGRFLRDPSGRTPLAVAAGASETSQALVLHDRPVGTPDWSSLAAAWDASDAAGNCISIHGAREHNLKNISLTIPRGKFVVVTGVSGSGKSTLAFDLIFAEGQRRFLDAMGTYARQFVEQMSRPDVDRITGIPPTVSIEQRTTRGGGKSTVATVTEIHHFLRLLFARLGTQHCPDCLCPVEGRSRDAVAIQLRAEARERGDLTLLAPVVKNRKGFHSDVALWAAKHGHARVRADGKFHRTDEPFRLDRFKEHDVEIDMGVFPAGVRTATAAQQALVDGALEVGHGTLFALDATGQLTVHSTERACPECSRSFQPLDPKMFSYNSSQGWCPKCRGFGELFYLPEVERGANADAIEESWWSWQDGKREPCPECHGARLNPVARAVRLVTAPVAGKRGAATSRASSEAPTIDTFAALPVAGALEKFQHLRFTGTGALIARDILPEIRERLRFLAQVGLGYLQLGRGVTTLSGGEAQRIRLAAQLGSTLSGVLYVLDEPTIGLHARDNEHLLSSLQLLRARGNSLLVVEHDEETMRQADWIVDLGPGAGVHGGQVIASGTLTELLSHEDSITGRSLREQAARTYPARGQRRLVVEPPARPARGRPKKAAADAPAPAPWLTLAGARVNNLKDLSVRIPLERFVVVTGVSGSGKSTLVRECLLPTLTNALARQPAKTAAGAPAVGGHDSLKAVYEVDQSPIGRTPRSTPATYVGFFDDIRELFASTPEARLRGYKSSRFSFNTAAGRCAACEGAGVIKLEMNFLPAAFVRCETCGGSRFNPETLEIRWRDRTIAEVLDLSIDEALEVFAAQGKIAGALAALRDTGLGYLRLGQTSPTLSGGEAQRVKLVTHLLGGLKEAASDLPNPRMRRKLFILEEPTIGLHLADVRRLVEVIQRLVDRGHSVVVIEHNLDLIAEADWVIDLGPEAGDAGGEIVAAGTPEAVAQVKGSHTARFLRPMLKRK